MRITAKGQVTIPQQIREEAGFLPHTEVEFIVEKDAVRIVKARRAAGAGRGAMVVQRLRGSARSSALSTDEIMALTRSEG